MKLFLKLILSVSALIFSFSAQAQAQTNVRIFEYKDLKQSIKPITKHLHDYGFIAVRGVPGYPQAYQDYLAMARAFVASDESIKDQCTPKESFSTGWSYGIEVFNGKKDSYKGSYYIAIGDQIEAMRPNVWPPKTWDKAAEFKRAYLTLANLIYDTGKEILPLLDLHFDKLSATGRMLYYGAIPEGENDGNPNWCGKHRDHGIFTGLTPATYVKKGKIVPKPAGSGLHIRGKEINVPQEVMLFQVAEVADLLTNQKIIATDHHVKKAFNGHERFALALFFGIDETMPIHSTSIDPEYKARFKDGMTYAEWCAASYERYKPRVQL